MSAFTEACAAFEVPISFDDRMKAWMDECFRPVRVVARWRGRRFTFRRGDAPSEWRTVRITSKRAGGEITSTFKAKFT